MREIWAFLLVASCLVSWADERPVIWDPPASLPTTLRDIVSRLPKDSDARDDCPITWGHEGSHFLARGKPGYHGIYMLGGRMEYIPTPPILTEAVFRRIPMAKRGRIYETYRKQGTDPYWQTQPLMLCDEWVAYLRGSMIRRELGWTKRQETNTYCATMADYCEVLCEMARQVPNYDCTTLRAFCHNVARDCRAVIPEWDQLTSARFD